MIWKVKEENRGFSYIEQKLDIIEKKDLKKGVGHRNVACVFFFV